MRTFYKYMRSFCIMKIVVDTNVYVEAFFDKEEKHSSSRLVTECSQGVIILVYTPDIKDEVLQVLKSVHVSRAFLERADQTFSTGKELSDVAQLELCADPNDNKFIDCAVAGDVRYLISRDSDLRALDGYHSVKVRTASEFYQEKSLWCSLLPSP